MGESKPVSDAPLDGTVIEKAQRVEILDIDGKKTTLQTLLEKQESNNKRLLVVLIRHFRCNLCMDYISGISEHLQASPTDDFDVVFIGCGTAPKIRPYIRNLSCRYQVYANPSMELYDLFGCVRTMAQGSSSDYIKGSIAMKGISAFFKAAKGVPSQGILGFGDIRLNGGEYLFERKASDAVTAGDEKWEMTWSHRMRNTRDHTEIYDLQALLGLPVTARRSDRGQSISNGESCSPSGQCAMPAPTSAATMPAAVETK